jgi:hypothetical protein
LIEHIERESSQAKLQDVFLEGHVLLPLMTPFPNVAAKVKDFRVSREGLGSGGLHHLKRGE